MKKSGARKTRERLPLDALPYTLGVESLQPTTGTSGAITRISTRRFFWRSWAVAFGAIGWLAPKPATAILCSGRPARFIRSATASARAVLRWKLLGYFSRTPLPAINWLSVWPATMIFNSPAAGDFNTRTNSSSSCSAPGFSTASPLSKRMSVSSLLMPVSGSNCRAGISLGEFGELPAQFGRQAAAAEGQTLELVVELIALVLVALQLLMVQAGPLLQHGQLLLAVDQAVLDRAAMVP